MFGDLSSLSSSLSGLGDEDRTRLAQLISDRNDYLVQLIKLNELKVIALTKPSPAAESAVKDFNAAVVAPLRDGLSQNMVILLDRAVDGDSVKGLMPMVVMGLLQSVNLPLLLATLGLEVDTVDKIIGEIKKFVGKDM